MSFEGHPTEDNVQYLQQGIQMIRRLDDQVFAGHDQGTSRRGVGAQFRHCIDFYRCFLDGLTHRRVDYTARARDAKLEVDRPHAVQAFERVISGLSTVDPCTIEAGLLVRMEGQATGWCRSSVLRELQFLHSHTIHHYALIANLLQQQGCPLGEEFAELGVAPSTRTYWKATRSATP